VGPFAQGGQPQRKSDKARATQLQVRPRFFGPAPKGAAPEPWPHLKRDTAPVVGVASAFRVGALVSQRFGVRPIFQSVGAKVLGASIDVCAALQLGPSPSLARACHKYANAQASPFVRAPTISSWRRLQDRRRLILPRKSHLHSCLRGDATARAPLPSNSYCAATT